MYVKLGVNWSACFMYYISVIRKVNVFLFENNGYAQTGHLI